MKLSKLYSDRPHLYKSVTFAPGVNTVVAEIRLPENRLKDTHNLGKSTLGRMLDFCLLAGRDPEFFLFKHQDQFSAFVFFLEVELRDGTFLTVRRGVENHSRIAFKKHPLGQQDFSGMPELQWDHSDVPLDRAREILDSLLDWRAMKPWQYRKGLGYFLRSQDDYRDVFQLRRFASAHGDWKPFLAQMLGFDSDTITLHYGKEVELEDKKVQEQNIQNELGGSIQDISKIEGMLLLKEREVEKTQSLLNAFDFRTQDKDRTKQLVDEFDVTIAQLNETRYSLSQNKKKIVISLNDEAIVFEPEKAKQLFQEAGILFDGQIKRDFEQLIAFNKAITEERRAFLEEERTTIDAQLKQVNSELTKLGKKRSDALSFLSETDVFGKYKRMSQDLVAIKADIIALERQREFLHRLQDLRSAIRTLRDDLQKLQSKIEADVEKNNADKDSLFSTIRLHFSDFVEEVIGQKALLSVSPNAKGHLEFKAEILNDSGKATSADMGHTYRKLLCIAFDMAVLRAHLEVSFPRFVYHDGVFESLDDRKKENLIAVIREYAELGIQPIVTLIDSDLPPHTPDLPVFDDDEIVLRLHDQGTDGRLFMMDSW